jgi:transposase
MWTRLDEQAYIEGPKGKLAVPGDDGAARRFAMLYEGVCEGLGPTRAAEKYGYTKQRFYQLRKAVKRGGLAALQSEKRGPKTHYRRTDEVVRQVIRHRFLDPEASPQVVAQKLKQTGHPISVRSVQRVIEEYGLQKKTS